VAAGPRELEWEGDDGRRRTARVCGRKWGFCPASNCACTARRRASSSSTAPVCFLRERSTHVPDCVVCSRIAFAQARETERVATARLLAREVVLAAQVLQACVRTRRESDGSVDTMILPTTGIAARNIVHSQLLI